MKISSRIDKQRYLYFFRKIELLFNLWTHANHTHHMHSSRISQQPKNVNTGLVHGSFLPM